MQQHAGDATAAAQRSHHRRKPAHRSRPRVARSWESTNRQAVVHRHQMDGISLDGRRCRRPPLVLARCLEHRGPSKAAGTVNPSSAFHSLGSRNRRELSGETQFHALHPNSKLPLPLPRGYPKAPAPLSQTKRRPMMCLPRMYIPLRPPHPRASLLFHYSIMYSRLRVCGPVPCQWRPPPPPPHPRYGRNRSCGCGTGVPSISMMGGDPGTSDGTWESEPTSS